MSAHAADQFQVKAIVGAGSFALPWVLKNEGVAGGILTIVVAGLLSSYTMKQLVRCKDHVQVRFPRKSPCYAAIIHLMVNPRTRAYAFVFTYA